MHYWYTMHKRLLLTAGLGLLLFAAPATVIAQAPDTNLSMEEMLAVFALQFDLTLPDTTFQEMDPGTVWEEAGTEAKIMCIAMPAPFERVLQDTTEMKTSPEMILLSKGRLDMNGLAGYLVHMEFVQPEGSGSPEPFIGLMYMRPLDAQTTLTINVAFPKSHYERLYSKMLVAFASVHQRTPGNKQ